MTAAPTLAPPPTALPSPAPEAFGTRRSRRRQPRPLDIAIDAAAVVLLSATALSAFVGTFLGWAWAVTAGVGLVVGVLVALGMDRVRAPWWVAVPALLVVSVLLAPPLTLRGTAAGAVPSPASWAALADTTTGGWRRLLTTLPPIDGAGPLSLLPLLLALGAGCAGMLLARRTSAPHLPSVVPAVVAVAAVGLGVAAPGGVVLRGALLFAGGVVWGAQRARRTVVVHSAHSLERVATAALLLGVVGVVVLGAIPWAGTSQRQVLREHVAAPFSATDRPSPLAAFRAFRPTNELADQELLTVRGLPGGTLVRLATVDTYSGTVWAAGNATESAAVGSGSFLRVGARIPRADGGTAATVRVTVGAAWAGRRDLGIWVPTVGSETRLAFTGDRAQDLDDALRYNLDTGAAVLPEGLSPGETLRARRADRRTGPLGARDTAGRPRPPAAGGPARRRQRRPRRPADRPGARGRGPPALDRRLQRRRRRPGDGPPGALRGTPHPVPRRPAAGGGRRAVRRDARPVRRLPRPARARRPRRGARAGRRGPRHGRPGLGRGARRHDLAAHPARGLHPAA